MEKKNLLLFFLIVFISGIFRVTSPSLIEFKSDEAINLFLASRPVFGHLIAPGGTVSSVGVLNPPLFNYFLLPLVIISKDPKVISMLIGLINSIAIGLLFLILKRYYGLKIALVSSLLLSLSPWSILYSRKIWNQDIILPLSLPLIYSFHKLIIEKNLKYWMLYMASSLFLIQIHQASIFFISLITIFLILQKARIDLRYILIGLFIGIIPLVPYIGYELRNQCPDCKSFIMVKDKLSIKRSLGTFLRPLQITSQGDFHFIIGDDMVNLAKDFPIVYNLRRIFYLEYLILPIGIIVFVKKFKSLKGLAFTTVILPFLYFIFKIEPFMHYYIILTPLLFLFLGYGFCYFLNSKNSIVRNIFLCLLIILIITSYLFNYAFYSLLKKQSGFKGDYGTIFAVDEEKTMKRLLKYKGQKDYEEILLASYVPISSMYGYTPIGSMIYPDKISINELPILERKLKENPEDMRNKDKLIAYYTKTPPTEKTLEILRSRYQEIPEYMPLYDSVYHNYLSKNLKKTYSGKIFNLAFEYPEHWTIEENNSFVKIKGDGYLMLITSFDNSPNQKLDVKSLCSTDDKKWCGVWNGSIKIGQDRYSIKLEIEDKNKLPLLGDKNLQNAIDTLNKVLSSLRSGSL